MGETSAIPKQPARREDWQRDDGRSPSGVRRFTNLSDWLSKPDKSVTRAELWELLNRYEAGRVALEQHNFERYCEATLKYLRAQAWYRRLWRWVLRRPAPQPPRLPAEPLREM